MVTEELRATGAHLVNPPAEVVSIQHLRALAALLVVFVHAQEQYPIGDRIIPSAFGLGGVDLFFLISGFVMTFTAAQRPLTRLDFLRRRLVRIVPLYWTMTLVTAVLIFVAPVLTRDSRFAWSDLFTSLSFIPHYNAGKAGSISPIIKLGWTLNYEMFFYLVFAAFLPLKPWLRTAAALLVFAVLIALKTTTQSRFVLLAFWGQPITLEFIAGCAVAVLYTRGPWPKTPAALWWAMLALGVVAFVGLGGFQDEQISRVFTRGLPALAILVPVLALERQGAARFRRGVVHYLGDASYSIYLAHLYAVVGFRVLCDLLHLPITTSLAAVIFIIACVAVGVGGGCLVYQFLERPLTKGVRRLFMQPREPAEAALA